MYQIQRFHSFLWASGGNYSDFYIHIIDHLGWMKNAWPVKAQALGGRHYRQSPEGITYVDQNFDTYAVEYTYADGTKFNFDGRCMTGCQDIYSSYLHGTKGMAIASKSGDCGMPSSILQRPEPEARRHALGIQGHPGRAGSLPERMERPDGRHPQRQALQRSQARRRSQPRDLAWAAWPRTPARKSPSRTCSTASTKWRRAWTSSRRIRPAPLLADANGRYPVPQPGIVTKREY